MSMGTRSIAAVAVLYSAVLGCGEPACPNGYDKRGHTCYRRDASALVAEDDERDASHGGADASGDDDEMEPETDAGTDAGRSTVDASDQRAEAGRQGVDAGETTAADSAASCAPSAEVCDGKDNDCDGRIDEEMQTCNGTCSSANWTGGCTLSGGGSGVCSARSCVECASGSDCPSGRPYCVLNQCRPCNGRCGVGGNCSRADDCSSDICTAGTCRPNCSGSCGIGASCSVDNDCGGNNQCVNNGCVDCASDGNCPASAPYCNANVCRQCRSNNSALCAAGQECVGEDCRTLIPSCQNVGNCSATASNSSAGCRNNLCQFSGQPYTCPTPASGWSYFEYVNVNDIYTHNAGLPMCLLFCPSSQCPRGYTCTTKTHTNLMDSSTSSVHVCWPDHFR